MLSRHHASRCETDCRNVSVEADLAERCDKVKGIDESSESQFPLKGVLYMNCHITSVHSVYIVPQQPMLMKRFFPK